MVQVKIAIVGEAWGEQEELRGEAFVGDSGRLLDNLLAMTGLNRAEIYLTNVYNARPPGNDFRSRFYTKIGEPTQELLDLWKALHQDLSDRQPNITLALGAEALAALVGPRKISEWRGSLFQVEGIGKVLGTYHPASILRSGDKRETGSSMKTDDSEAGVYSQRFASALFDFAKAKRESLSSSYTKPFSDIKVIEDFATFTHLSEEMHKAPFLAIDLEVINQEIDCIGLSWEEGFGIVIPIFELGSGKPLWTSAAEALIWHEIASLLASSSVGKIIQEANFDIHFLERHGMKLNNLAMDTLNAHHSCYPETAKSLAFLCSIYTAYPFYKDQISVDRHRYCAMDAIVTRVCFSALCKELEDLGLASFYHSFINKLILPYKRVADRGIDIDLEKRAELGRVIAEKLDAIEGQIKLALRLEGLSPEINLRSPKQVADLLYSTLKIAEIKKRRASGKDSLTVDEEALRSILKKQAGKVKESNLKIAIPKLLLEHRSLDGMRETLSAQLDPDQKLRTSYRVSGTVSGRLASRKTLYKTGVDLQNLSRDPLFEGCSFGVRSIISPGKSFEIVEGDLSGADARVVAQLAEEPAMLALFLSGADIHAENAKLLFGSKEITLEQRQKAKTCGHAANYRVGVDTFAKNLGISRAEASRLLDCYLHQLYPRIPAWHRKIEEKLRSNRIITTAMGRRRTFFGRWGESLFAAATAYEPQSVVADVTHRGFLALDEEIEQRDLFSQGISIMMNNHDSLAVRSPVEKRSLVVELIKRNMEIEISFPAGKMTIPVGIKVGKNWFEMEKI